MRINSSESIALGERIHNQYGSWQKARQAANLQDGVYVLKPAVEPVSAPQPTGSPKKD